MSKPNRTTAANAPKTDRDAVAGSVADRTPAAPNPQATETTDAAGLSAAASAASVELPETTSTDGTTYGPVGWIVRVVGPAKGRWRIGRHFTPEAVDIPASELTHEQTTALMNDPALLVVAVSVDG